MEASDGNSNSMCPKVSAGEVISADKTFNIWEAARAGNSNLLMDEPDSGLAACGTDQATQSNSTLPARLSSLELDPYEEEEAQDQLVTLLLDELDKRSAEEASRRQRNGTANRKSYASQFGRLFALAPPSFTFPTTHPLSYTQDSIQNVISRPPTSLGSYLRGGGSGGQQQRRERDRAHAELKAIVNGKAHLRLHIVRDVTLDASSAIRLGVNNWLRDDPATEGEEDAAQAGDTDTRYHEMYLEQMQKQQQLQHHQLQQDKKAKKRGRPARKAKEEEPKDMDKDIEIIESNDRPSVIYADQVPLEVRRSLENQAASLHNTESVQPIQVPDLIIPPKVSARAQRGLESRARLNICASKELLNICKSDPRLIRSSMRLIQLYQRQLAVNFQTLKKLLDEARADHLGSQLPRRPLNLSSSNSSCMSMSPLSRDSTTDALPAVPPPVPTSPPSVPEGVADLGPALIDTARALPDEDRDTRRITLNELRPLPSRISLGDSCESRMQSESTTDIPAPASAPAPATPVPALAAPAPMEQVSDSRLTVHSQSSSIIELIGSSSPDNEDDQTMNEATKAVGCQGVAMGEPTELVPATQNTPTRQNGDSVNSQSTVTPTGTLGTDDAGHSDRSSSALKESTHSDLASGGTLVVDEAVTTVHEIGCLPCTDVIASNKCNITLDDNGSHLTQSSNERLLESIAPDLYHYEVTGQSIDVSVEAQRNDSNEDACSFRERDGEDLNPDDKRDTHSSSEHEVEYSMQHNDGKSSSYLDDYFTQHEDYELSLSSEYYAHTCQPAFEALPDHQPVVTDEDDVHEVEGKGHDSSNEASKMSYSHLCTLSLGEVIEDYRKACFVEQHRLATLSENELLNTLSRYGLRNDLDRQEALHTLLAIFSEMKARSCITEHLLGAQQHCSVYDSPSSVSPPPYPNDNIATDRLNAIGGAIQLNAVLAGHDGMGDMGGVPAESRRGVVAKAKRRKLTEGTPDVTDQPQAQPRRRKQAILAPTPFTTGCPNCNFTNFILEPQSEAFYMQMLKFEPINFDDLFFRMKQAGVQGLSAAALRRFLIDRGIAYVEPGTVQFKSRA